MSGSALAAMRLRNDGLVPKERYLSDDFARLEYERLWSRVWQVVGREEEIPAVGDHLTYDIGTESCVVVRDESAGIRAFHNACLHRGTRLADDRGCFEGGRIRCRYHAWQYALDGQLAEVPDRAEFEALPADLSLREICCDTWGGFVFVNLDPDAQPLAEYLDPIPRLLAPFHLEQMQLRAVLTTELPANWKAVVDAFNEAYHVQGTHPQILPWTDDVSITYEQIGKHSRYGRLPGARRELRPSPRLAVSRDEVDEGEILASLVKGLGGAFLAEEQELVAELREQDLPPGELLPEYQRRRRDLLSGRGLDVSELDDNQMTSAEDFFWFPNLVGPIYPGSAILFRVRPVASDHRQSVKDTWVLQWPEADREPRPPTRRSFSRWESHDWGEITTQDYENMAAVQRGMESSGFRGLMLNPRQEANILHMHRVIDDYLFD